MGIQRMDNVGIVVEDMDAAIAFFVELGMELEGRAETKGTFADQCTGLDGVRCDIAMLRTPDGHSRLELAKYHSPAAISAGPRNRPHNVVGTHRVMLAVDDIEDTVTEDDGLMSSRDRRASRRGTCYLRAAPVFV
ncbi:VOC family protein [Streptomyces sp. NPDC001351]|uniref:VOC family protein n=1 Tax=Streptomyces sp. NPDC001351 TaxID=3364564 RepID=UPI00368CF895